MPLNQRHRRYIHDPVVSRLRQANKTIEKPDPSTYSSSPLSEPTSLAAQTLRRLQGFRKPTVAWLHGVNNVDYAYSYISLDVIKVH